MLLIVPLLCSAGGDYVQGRISKMSGEYGSYSFVFSQSDNRSNIVGGCREFTVRVSYSHVPWFSWLPFVRSSHPSFEQTENAAAILKMANSENSPIYFGYMGNGLVATDAKCVFDSKGLQVIDDKDKIVLSFYSVV